MKYLFFDIECSNCFDGIGKMCEFGYVLTDESFNVIKSDDIPMSPGKGYGSRFNLTGRKYEKDLQLAYDYDFYFSQPEFPHFYKKIKALMEDPETICFAYSMDNDIPHLYHACKRYGYNPFNYKCYDVQKFVATYLEKKGQMGLHRACLEIVGPNSTIKLQEHLSRDDAEMERMIFEAICILTKMDSKKLLEESKFAYSNSIEYMEKLYERRNKKKLKTEAFKLYKSLALPIDELEKPENIGRRYNVSGEVKSHPEILNCVIKQIKKSGGVFSNRLEQTDFFILYNEDNRQEILKCFKYPFNGKMLTYDEFMNLK